MMSNSSRQSNDRKAPPPGPAAGGGAVDPSSGGATTLYFQCPACKKTYHLRIQLGQKVQCACGNRFFLRSEDLVAPARRARVAAPVGARLKPGDTLGRCRVLRYLGGGSTGQVFLAEHTVLHIHVALKVLTTKAASDPEYRERFLREARTAAELDHPNVVRVLDCGIENDCPYLVMQYIEGGTAADRLARGPLPVAEVLAIGRDAGRALLEAENRGIVHRDIKPQNLMLTPEGQCKLADLGLARHVSGAGKTAGLTQDARGMGTPYYMPPEQIRDARSVDSRADIYALGATLFHLAAGRPPYPGKNAIEVLRKHLDSPIPSLQEIDPKIPRNLDLVIQHCLRKNCEERYQSVGEFLHDIETLIRNPHAPPRNLIAGRRGRVHAETMRRHRLEWVLGFILVTILLAPFAWRIPRGFQGRVPLPSLVPADTDPVRREILLLKRGLAAGGPRIERAELEARLAAAYARAREMERALGYLSAFFRDCRYLPRRQRSLTLPWLRRVALEFLNGVPGNPELRAAMDSLRGLSRGVFAPRQLFLDRASLEAIARAARLHAVVLPASDFWGEFRYGFRNPAGKLDFYATHRDLESGEEDGGGSPALSAARVRDGRLAAAAPSAAGCRLLWRIPPGPLFQCRMVLDFAERTGAVECFVGVPDYWAGVPVGGRFRIEVAPLSGKNRVRIRVFKRGNLLAKSTAPLSPDRTVSLAMSVALPGVSIRVGGRKICTFEIRERGRRSLPGKLGIRLVGSAAMRAFVVRLPVEELVKPEARENLAFCSAFGYPSDRFDLPARFVLGCGPQIPERKTAAGTDLRRLLDRVDGLGVVLTRPAKPATGRRRLCAWFPLRRQTVVLPMDVRWGCVFRGGGISGGKTGAVPVQVQVYNFRKRRWETARAGQSRPIGAPGSPENGGRLVPFLFQRPATAPYVNVYDEILVRWTAAAPPANPGPDSAGSAGVPGPTAPILDYVLMVQHQLNPRPLETGLMEKASGREDP